MRIALVGLGFMGVTHARAWQRIPGAELYAVISSDERKLSGDVEQVGGNLGTGSARLDFSTCRKYRSYAEALADPQVDAVDLCIPTDGHVDAAIAALRKGKHVLVEKPLALSEEDALRTAAEARTAGRVLMVAQVLRFMPAYVEARRRIGELGRVYSATFSRRCAAPAWSRWLKDAHKSGGGAFDLLIHDADYVHWLFGPPRNIQAGGAVNGQLGIDLVNASLEYPSCSVNIAGGWYLNGSYPFSMGFTIVCEQGILEYAGGQLTEYRTGAAAAPVPLPNSDAFEAELAHFHDCAMRNEPSEVCPVEESVASVRLMLAILEHRQSSLKAA